MNLVAIIGNVASAPETRTTASGKTVTTFRIAVTRPGDADADFFTVVCWERQAEIAERYLTIGRKIGVEGRLAQRTWETDEGKRSVVEVVSHRLQLLTPPREGEGE